MHIRLEAAKNNTKKELFWVCLTFFAVVLEAEVTTKIMKRKENTGAQQFLKFHRQTSTFIFGRKPENTLKD